MARSKSRQQFRLKPVGYALAALVGGIVLLVVSQKVKPAAGPPSAAPASEPAPAPDSPAPAPAPKRQEAAAENMSGLLLLFSMASFLVCIICIGWIVVNVRNARPAWKTQTKYPKRR